MVIYENEVKSVQKQPEKMTTGSNCQKDETMDSGFNEKNFVRHQKFKNAVTFSSHFIKMIFK